METTETKKQQSKGINLEVVSECCGTKVDTDYLICPDCKEHCGGMRICDVCQDLFEYEEKNQDCPYCDDRHHRETMEALKVRQ